MPAANCSNPLDDIEDIVGALDLNPRAGGREKVVPRSRRRKKVEPKEEEETNEPVILDSVVPGIAAEYLPYFISLKTGMVNPVWTQFCFPEVILIALF